MDLTPVSAAPLAFMLVTMDRITLSARKAAPREKEFICGTGIWSFVTPDPGSSWIPRTVTTTGGTPHGRLLRCTRTTKLAFRLVEPEAEMAGYGYLQDA
jgi:hypothetical protein